MKKASFLLLTIAWSIFSCGTAAQNVDKPMAFQHAEEQTRIMLKEIGKAKKTAPEEAVVPRTLTESGDLHLVKSKDWTSGFFPGTLWYIYENTGDQYWLEQAQKYTAKIEQEKFDVGTHDTGFKIYCSFGNGYRITNKEEYKKVIVQTAKTLSKRYNPEVGAIRSWDHNTDKWDYPVIIDNMMNLELLFAATRFSGDSTYYDIAVDHANTTLKNHFRKDYSSFHVIDYNPETGEVENRNTHQGYSDESAWARGQAWGLYGYVFSYRETHNKRYLAQAENIADFILNHPKLPKDMVPYWDFDAPDLENEPRDVSAAAIIASALYELSTFSSGKKKYRQAADRILSSLSTKYTSPKGDNKGFILQNSTGHKPHNSEVDVPLNYADYYYLEALHRRDI
ncbi:glycoside hydrolase family 88 protein [Salegentibacter sp. BDJ18]|uniref:glycoside hydrolase family 88 protein n=1 Tax=Salegentibacter sp. BDJ18 TaxID=2816376 RepID=UPI001AAE8EF9|nr:glycoside hydrolase family 88 protein [Salegentibacter sp. BDJ18]MBO2543176.1 glycoside hydrolase family 88 protein [Salegentibacter sp. BDJ18]